MMLRPKSKDVSHFNESPAPSSPVMNNSHDFPGQQGMYGARSSPALTGARSHDNLQREDPYASIRGSGGARPVPLHHHHGSQTHMLQSASYYNMQDQKQRELARKQALRSKSTSQLDRHDLHEAQPYRQVMLTSTLPHSYSNHQQHHAPQQHQQQLLQKKFPSQPDLQHRPGEGQPNYENYQGQQRPPLQLDDPYSRDRYEQLHYMNHTELRNQFNKEQEMNADMMRGTQSMGNLRGEPEQPRPDTVGLHQPKSKEFDHMHEWQQRNELERQRLQQQQGPRGAYNQGYKQQQQPVSGYVSPLREMQ